MDDYGIDPDIEEFDEQCDRNLARERQSIANALTAATIQFPVVVRDQQRVLVR